MALGCLGSGLRLFRRLFRKQNLSLSCQLCKDLMHSSLVGHGLSLSLSLSRVWPVKTSPPTSPSHSADENQILPSVICTRSHPKSRSLPASLSLSGSLTPFEALTGQFPLSAHQAVRINGLQHGQDLAETKRSKRLDPHTARCHAAPEGRRRTVPWAEVWQSTTHGNFERWL